MNCFVDILNRIRQSADSTWLTPSQQRAQNALLERLKFLDEVNVWGHPGTGKTFLGWMLQKQRVAEYVPSAEQIRQASLFHTIIVDNVGWRRKEVRDIVYLVRLSGYRRVVLITQEPVQEHMATVEVLLNHEDVERVIANLYRIRVTPLNNAPQTLWDLVSPIPLNPSKGRM